MLPCSKPGLSSSQSFADASSYSNQHGDTGLCSNAIPLHLLCRESTIRAISVFDGLIQPLRHAGARRAKSIMQKRTVTRR